MQLLISNLEAEKRALNQRLREANVRKIEAASLLKQGPAREENAREENVFELCMLGAGILETSVALSGAHLVGPRGRSCVYITNLQGISAFEKDLLKKLRQ